MNEMLLMATDEQALLSGAREKDPLALEEFVERYKKYVYFLGLSLTGNHHDAEDLSQDVFIKAFASIQNFRGDSKLTSWLHRITVNAYLDQKGHRTFRILRGGESLDDTETQFAEHRSGSDPEKEIHQKDVRTAIEKALNELGPRQKAVFVLRHYGEQSMKEIAEEMNISEGTVKSSLFHAVRKLQKALGKYQFQEDL